MTRLRRHVPCPLCGADKTPAAARCKECYHSDLRTSLSDLERFMLQFELADTLPLEWTSKTKPATPCHLWTGSLDEDGYARFTVKTDYAKNGGWQVVYAHRWIKQQESDVAITWEPCRKFLYDHVCRVHLCVRQDHLELVTTKENLNRGHDARGSRNFCRNGHDKDIVGRVKENSCKECAYISIRRYQQRPEVKYRRAADSRNRRLSLKESSK